MNFEAVFCESQQLLLAASFLQLKTANMNIVRSFLHALASRPGIYDLIQRLAGVDLVHRRLAPYLRLDDPGATILDVGGGTGIVRRLLPASARYICLDIEQEKLNLLRAKHPDATAVLGDGLRLPVMDESIDLALCIFVAHHIPESLLPALVAEIHRVLRAGGRLVLVDPVWSPARMLGRLIWYFDRGSHPYNPDALRSHLQTSLEVTQADSFSVFHEYWFFAAIKKQSPGA